MSLPTPKICIINWNRGLTVQLFLPIFTANGDHFWTFTRQILIDFLSVIHYIQ